jgi:hypothetical protein
MDLTSKTFNEPLKRTIMHQNDEGKDEEALKNNV